MTEIEALLRFPPGSRVINKGHGHGGIRDIPATVIAVGTLHPAGVMVVLHIRYDGRYKDQTHYAQPELYREYIKPHTKENTND